LSLVELELVHFAHVGVADLVAHGAHDIIEARYNGRVRYTQLLLDVLDLAPALDKGLDELDLLGSERLKAAETESAVNACAASAAL
jgi:hypothetical protein